MPAHGNSSLHHQSCAQVQRQHQQVGGSCRFYPASRHSHSPHQLRLRTFNLSTDPGIPLSRVFADVRNEVALSASHLPRRHFQCVAASSPISVVATPKPHYSPCRASSNSSSVIVSGINSWMMLSYVPAVNTSNPVVQTMLDQLLRRRRVSRSIGIDKLHRLHGAHSAHVLAKRMLPLPGESVPLKLLSERAGASQ